MKKKKEGGDCGDEDSWSLNNEFWELVKFCLKKKVQYVLSMPKKLYETLPKVDL